MFKIPIQLLNKSTFVHVQLDPMSVTAAFSLRDHFDFYFCLSKK